MPTLIENLYSIDAIKSDIKSAIEAKGVDMTSASFADYPSKIGDITTSFVTETLSVSVNGTYYPGQGVDGFSQVVVDVPQSVTGWTDKDITEVKVNIVNLNNSASYVGSYAFEEHNTLQTVNLPNCTSVYHNAFQSCENLSEVNMPICSIIGDSAFYNDHNIINISLPECTYIGQNAFQYNTELISVSLPKCSFISNLAFWNCSKLTNVYLPECEKLGTGAFSNASVLVSVYLPKCSGLGGTVFAGCSSLTSISLPVCVSMGGNAFQNCKSLVSLNLSICYSIGGNICQNCSSLEEFTLPMTYYFFSYSNMLTNTKIASGVGSIYVPDFNYDKYVSATGWSSLAARFVSVPCSNTLFYSDGLVYGGTNWLEYSFTSYLGINYLSVTDINLPNCTSVYGNTLYNPPRLPFNQCRNLKTITIDLSVAGRDFCNGLSYLSYVSIPNCTIISSNAFNGCSSLTQVSFSKCETIMEQAFANCISLSSVYIPNCEHISTFAFYKCYSLSVIDLPECKYIGNSVFTSTQLPRIDLPKCSYIGERAFEYCKYLSEVYLRSNSVCSLKNYTTFAHTSCLFYVPASLVDAYKSAQYWDGYSSRIFPIPEP